MSKKLELAGMMFGKLLVISEQVERDKRGGILWSCLCNCGNTTIVLGTCLKSGHTTSCGCFVVEKARRHGLSGHPMYDAYYNMKARCYYPSHNSYANYGERGIVVCERWLESFNNFVEDMGDTWEGGLQLDRKDTNGNYQADNCRWVTKQQNTSNTRSTSGSSSKYKGVSWSKVAKKWIVSIMSNGKKYHLGYFEDEDIAAKTYNTKAAELFGEYAHLNDLTNNMGCIS